MNLAREEREERRASGEQEGRRHGEKIAVKEKRKGSAGPSRAGWGTQRED